MKIEITILSAPIRGSVIPSSPMVAEIGGIGTLIVNNHYSEGGACGYILTDADKAEIAALAAYDDTEVRALIDQRAQELGDYIGQNLSNFSQEMGQIDQRARQNSTEIESIGSATTQLSQAATQNEQAITMINATLGDIATIIDTINGEVV